MSQPFFHVKQPFLIGQCSRQKKEGLSIKNKNSDVKLRKQLVLLPEQPGVYIQCQILTTVWICPFFDTEIVYYAE